MYVPGQRNIDVLDIAEEAAQEATSAVGVGTLEALCAVEKGPHSTSRIRPHVRHHTAWGRLVLPVHVVACSRPSNWHGSLPWPMFEHVCVCVCVWHTCIHGRFVCTFALSSCHSSFLPLHIYNRYLLLHNSICVDSARPSGLLQRAQGIHQSCGTHLVVSILLQRVQGQSHGTNLMVQAAASSRF